MMRDPLLRTVLLLLSIALAGPLNAGTPTLLGRWGDRWQPQQFVRDYKSKKTRALVVVAFSTRCPLSKRIVPTLNELQAQFDEHGVQFIALFSNRGDHLQSIAEYAVDMSLSFPVFKDDHETPWHETLGLTTTPEVVVLDTREGYRDDRVVYRGQVNGIWAGGRKSPAHDNYLADALGSFVAGQKSPLSRTAASGCPISAKTHFDEAKHADVTYYKTIAPLIQTKCMGCHREGEAAAELFMAFDSYESVAGASEVILDRIENRIMPPWHGSTDPANGSGGFKNDLRLTEDEIDQFRAWVRRDCPGGDAADAPPEPQWPPADGWRIGKPDLVYQMPEPYIVPKDRLNEYQFYRIRMNFPEDRYIQAIEMQPGNAAVVHHMGAIIGPASDGELSANAAMLQLYGLTADKVKKIGDYVAGDPFNARTYPPGFALLLPARHDLFFEMHYTPTGRDEEPDISRMAIRWADQKPPHVILTKVFSRKDLRIPPHAAHYEKHSHYQFSTDVLIYALAPHMHVRGKDFTLYRVKNPQASEPHKELILKVPAYDANWQRTYEFVHPIALKAGEALISVAHFDNSHYNPFNPDPEAAVRFGLQTTDEMLNLRVKYEETEL